MTHSLIVLGGATCVAGVAVVLRHWGSRQPASSDRPPDRTTGERFPRSRLLERATIGIGALIALGIAVPSVGLAALPSFLRRRDPAIDLGPTTSFPVDEFIVATFLSNTEAGEVSRAPHTSATTVRWGTFRASRSCRAAARTSDARRSQTGQSSEPSGDLHTQPAAKLALSPPSRLGSVARATPASSTPRGTGLRDRRLAP